MMPRFPVQPPAPEVDAPVVLLGTLLEETTVAETLFLKVGNCDVDTEVVVSSAAGVAGTGMTVTVEGDEDGVFEGEAIVGSRADVDVVSGVETGTEGDAAVETSVTGTAEGWVEGAAALSVTPVMALTTEGWLGTGEITLGDSATSDVVPRPGVTVTVTTGFSVTVTISESHGSMLEPPGLPA